MGKYLWIKGCAGLGNRLYTLTAAIEYAKKTKRILYVDWSDGQFAAKGENAFYKVFDLRDVDYITNISQIGAFAKEDIYPSEWYDAIYSRVYDLYELANTNSTWIQKIPSHLSPRGRFKKIHNYWCSIAHHNIYQTKNNSILPFWLQKENIPLGDDLSYRIKNKIVVFVDYCPPLRSDLLTKHVKLKPEIINKVKQFIDINQLRGKLVGVHIRNTDKKPSSSIESLANYLSSNQYKNKYILLCTDNPDTENMLKSKLDNVVIYKKNSSRDSLLPPHRIAYDDEVADKSLILEESLIDMYLLSECDELLYQGNSSFSNISLAHRKNNNKPSTDWMSLV